MTQEPRHVDTDAILICQDSCNRYRMGCQLLRALAVSKIQGLGLVQALVRLHSKEEGQILLNPFFNRKLYVYVCACVYIYTYTHTHTYTQTYTHTHLHTACMHTYIHTCIYTHTTCIYTFICNHVCTYIQAHCGVKLAQLAFRLTSKDFVKHLVFVGALHSGCRSMARTR